jgi:phosphatidylserine/phosphatidylglycerophosphate/cardiolipin synthase-like enzyme
MRRVLLVIAFLCATQAAVASSTIPAKGTIEVAFSPNGGATALVVKTIAGARKSILVQAYSFTSAPIARALAQAKERGVDVRVLLDESQRSERYTSATYLANHGVPVWIDSAHAIAHNKVMVIDGDTVITGSFNFTKAAEEKNAENVIVLRGNPELANVFAANWIKHQTHSERY